MLRYILYTILYIGKILSVAAGSAAAVFAALVAALRLAGYKVALGGRRVVLSLLILLHALEHQGEQKEGDCPRNAYKAPGYACIDEHKYRRRRAYGGHHAAYYP